MTFNPKNIYEFLFPPKDYPLEWHMVSAERVALEQVLHRLNPDVAIEIGTFKGGSLQCISPLARHTYSLDIDSSVAESLRPRFPDVSFLTGDSSKLLPQIFEEVRESNRHVNFILVDGDHSAEGVRRDLNTILEYVPQQPLAILMHDSFNPACREGMLTANWSASAHVAFVEIDFVCGQIISTEEPGIFGDMWGGLGIAYLTPEVRDVPVMPTQQYCLNYESSPRWISSSLARRRS